MYGEKKSYHREAVVVVRIIWHYLLLCVTHSAGQNIAHCSRIVRRSLCIGPLRLQHKH